MPDSKIVRYYNDAGFFDGTECLEVDHEKKTITCIHPELGRKPYKLSYHKAHIIRFDNIFRREEVKPEPEEKAKD